MGETERGRERKGHRKRRAIQRTGEKNELWCGSSPGGGSMLPVACSSDRSPTGATCLDTPALHDQYAENRLHCTLGFLENVWFMSDELPKADCSTVYWINQ